MSSKNGKPGIGGTPEGLLADQRIKTLQFGIQEQNTLLVNLSAIVHSIQQKIDLSDTEEGRLLLTGTADILAKADLPAAIHWIPPTPKG